MAALSIRTSSVQIHQYKDESDLPEIISMIAADLSEPYSIYVYRYFIHQWPELCFVVRETSVGRLYPSDLVGTCGRSSDRDDCVQA